MGALDELGQQRSILLYMKCSWLYNTARLELLQHHITTLPREQFTFVDCRISWDLASTFSSLTILHCGNPKDFQNKADEVHHAISSFISTQQADYITNLTGQQQVWLVPYVLLTMSDADHNSFIKVVNRDKLQLSELIIHGIHNKSLSYKTHQHTKCYCSFATTKSKHVITCKENKDYLYYTRKQICIQTSTEQTIKSVQVRPIYLHVSN